MARRIQTVLDHIAPSKTATAEHEQLKQHLLLQSLRAQMLPSDDRLKEMTLFMLAEMHRGLEPNNHSTLPMLPSFVFKRSPAESNGVVYALDLGGSNFRVLRLTIQGGNVTNSESKKYTIPKKIIEKGTGEQLFDFIAGSIEDFLASSGHSDEKGQPIRLGFTFSFPVQQLSIASGTLKNWTKEFATSGVVGNDVVALLSAAFQKHKIAFKVVALCNDTVGTLTARYFGDDSTCVGVILGTGSNACYWEQARNITKCAEAQRVAAKAGKDQDAVEMVVNMEFGNFDSKHLVVLPVTQYDQELDGDCEPATRGQQRFEKMISGKYLGEIARRVLVDFSKKGALPADVATRLSEAYKFESRTVGICVADHHPGLPDTFDAFKRLHGIELPQESQRRIVQTVCVLVSTRAAWLAAMAVAASVLKTNRQSDATVAVDGSVFEKQPYFKKAMETALVKILGADHGVRLVLTRDGSGVGAGCIAALQ